MLDTYFFNLLLSPFSPAALTFNLSLVFRFHFLIAGLHLAFVFWFHSLIAGYIQAGGENCSSDTSQFIDYVLKARKAL